MEPLACVKACRATQQRYLVGIVGLSVAVLVAGATQVQAQGFSSGSDGSDGTYAPSGPGLVIFDPSQFHGTQVSANIFNFTSILIPAGVTVQLSDDKLGAAVYWLAQGDVNIGGTIDLSGGDGRPATANPFLRVPSFPGAGGYAGGVGASVIQAALQGSGPGGGAAGAPDNVGNAFGGTFSGNQFLIPLIGGSGGGGGGARSDNLFSPGGGAGGGAFLIASSTQIIVTGTINANGGGPGNWNPPAQFTKTAGGGSGGAVRLVSNTIRGTGTLTALGGNNEFGRPGGAGQVRLEAATIAFAGVAQGTLGQSTPFPLLLPTAGPPTARVVSINGVLVNPNPSTFPDITINTGSAVPVVIQTHNIPTTATINLTILDENAVPDTVIQVPPLANCDQNNFCTATVNVVFPFGPSRGLTKVTWTQ